MTTLSILILSTVELSRLVRARGIDAIEHDLQTVGDAARFMWANFSAQRKSDVAWRHAAMCLEEAARYDDREYATMATVALEVLLDETGLLIE